MSARLRRWAAALLVGAFSVTVAGAHAAGIGVTSSGLTHRAVSSPCVPTWWDAAYGHRRQVSVTTAASAVGTDHSVAVPVDHAALVAAGKSLVGGDDLRVVALNSTTCTWTQLDRVVDDASSWNAPGTKIWFRLAAPVGADSSSPTAYFLYYGHPAAGAPPADAGTVFLFHDDFPGAGLGAPWTVLRAPTTWSAGGGSLEVTMDPGTDLLGASNTAPLFSVADPSGGVEVQVRQAGPLTADGHTVGIVAYAGDDDYVAGYHRFGAGAERVELVREVGGSAVTSSAAVAADPIHLRLTRLGGDYTVGYSTDGGTVFTQAGTTTAAVPATSLGLTAFSPTVNTTTVNLTDFRVRRLVASEPSTGVGAETARY